MLWSYLWCLSISSSTFSCWSLCSIISLWTICFKSFFCAFKSPRTICLRSFCFEVLVESSLCSSSSESSVGLMLFSSLGLSCLLCGQTIQKLYNFFSDVKLLTYRQTGALLQFFLQTRQGVEDVPAKHWDPHYVKHIWQNRNQFIP